MELPQVDSNAPNVATRSNAPKGATTFPKDDTVESLPGVGALAETANLPSQSRASRIVSERFSFFFMSIERLDVSALAFTSQQDDSRAVLSLLSCLVFLHKLTTDIRTVFERCCSAFAFAFIRVQDDNLRVPDLSCVVSNDRMSLPSPSQASRTIPEHCRSLTFWCFCLGVHLPAGRYLSVAALSLPSRSQPRKMILARLQSFSCLSNNWMSLLSPSRASRTISEPCRSFLTQCFRLSFQQPVGLYSSTGAFPLHLRLRVPQSAGCYLRDFDLSDAYRTIGCLCSRLHGLAGRFQSLVAH